MAIVLTPLNTSVNGGLDSIAGRKIFVGFVQAPDNSYPTGGYAVDPTLFGMAQIDQFYVGSTGVTAQQIFLVYTPSAPTALQTSNVKIRMCAPNTGVELANAFGAGTAIWPVVVVGI